MSDAPQSKAGLWARLMGGGDAPPAAPPETTFAEPAAGSIEAEDGDVELIDDTVSFDRAPDAAAESPTEKLPHFASPVPEFARNPLEENDRAEAPTMADDVPVAMPAATVETPVPDVPLEPCAACGTPRQVGAEYCHDCGYLFPDKAASQSTADGSGDDPDKATSANDTTSVRVKGRYLLGKLVSEKLGVKRFRGLDASCDPPLPVIVVTSAPEEPAPLAEAIAEDDEMLPMIEEPPSHMAETLPIINIETAADWPQPSWEKSFLASAHLPALPRVIDDFTEADIEYLVLEAPQGTSLWDAWDDADDAATRYGWLKELAETFRAVHKSRANFECLTPDQIVVDAEGHVRIADVADLLPLPVPREAPIRGTLSTPPELIASPEKSGPASGLYIIGAILYSLEYLHHGLEEKDFECPGTPKQITDRFPDVHPLLPRLINKTFVKDVRSRFPSDEAARTDPTGFQELIQTLGVCQRVFDNVRLDISAWTTTGMIRTGNEDAFAFLHGVDARQDDVHEYALVLLCDGMGGYEAGEVAAAIAIAEMKKFFLEQPMFAGLTGKEPFPGPIDVAAAKATFEAGIRHANKEVFAASRTPGKGKRGMGCTAEAVYLDSRHLIVSHVGDSRVYHLTGGRLTQLTRDQTLVNRLVELGQISEAEAEDHPRKNELQQAVGGQPDVTPGVYHSRLKRGDWVLVCSDGLSNHISHKELEQMLTREASNSAEEAARRLLNLVNLRGATDNATIVVVRAT
jgi:serine/threonine protein phosphatase PrpC